jgi:hypothetical protein
MFAVTPYHTRESISIAVVLPCPVHYFIVEILQAGDPPHEHIVSLFKIDKPPKRGVVSTNEEITFGHV